MGWRGVFYSSLFLLTLVESSSRSEKILLPYLGAQKAVEFSWPVFSASIFVFVALVLSMYLIFEHLASYNQPEEQKFLIGLILMVPVYALESVGRSVQLNSWKMILKMICALLAMILESFGVYGEGKFEWRYGYPYLAVVLNFSQTWALYCLVQFYAVIKEKLEPIRPLAKFLTFKSIVFLTWWQGVAIAFLFSMGAFKGSLAQELKTRIQDYIICIEMGVAAVVHLYVFPAVSYKRGERCVRNVAVMTDYASLGTPPDPEEVRDCERSTRMRLGRHYEREKHLNFPQSVRDVVLGSGEIIVDDMKYTVSHVVEPVERGIAKINETFHQISENVKRHKEERRRSSKDDSYLIPLNSWNREFSEARDNLVEGSASDGGLANGKKNHVHPKAAASGKRTAR
ncbi:protein LAZ1 homolog 1 isoform X4 [Durio zibethinus]|uniref:Protein LAZ1 homolog 1 isoform X4 n=1 Tax=Durio zibethinus TaxID=66656 RepID=A0A6P6B831_DURZI|nr:protein LAZ1 homolog 1 isoform X4 [Durio zibethinus]